uniref:DUF7027 domain-containing protein n=1 Tax=Plectus sambesii TaxID=2011161 RepID=A0A914XGU9_9BILA
MSQVQPRFDPNDPKYICCCGCHVMICAKLLASLFTIVAVLDAIAFSFGIYWEARDAQLRWDKVYYAVLVFMGINLIIGTAVLSCLWYGLIKKRERFLILTLVCSMLVFGATILSALFCIIAVIAAMIRSEAGTDGVQVLLVIIIASACCLIPQYCFFHIYKTAYYYIKHKRSPPTNVNINEEWLQKF